MKIDLKLSLAVVALLGILPAWAQSYDGPTSGTLVAEGGGILDFECIPSGPNLASCEFVQVLFSRKEPILVGGTKFPYEDNGFACCGRFHFVSRKVINSYKQIFGVRESRRKDEEVSM
jgi:hypothetical protein